METSSASAEAAHRQLLPHGFSEAVIATSGEQEQTSILHFSKPLCDCRDPGLKLIECRVSDFFLLLFFLSFYLMLLSVKSQVLWYVFLCQINIYIYKGNTGWGGVGWTRSKDQELETWSTHSWLQLHSFLWSTPRCTKYVQLKNLHFVFHSCWVFLSMKNIVYYGTNILGDVFQPIRYWYTTWLYSKDTTLSAVCGPALKNLLQDQWQQKVPDN